MFALPLRSCNLTQISIDCYILIKGDNFCMRFVYLIYRIVLPILELKISGKLNKLLIDIGQMSGRRKINSKSKRRKNNYNIQKNDKTRLHTSTHLSKSNFVKNIFSLLNKKIVYQSPTDDHEINKKWQLLAHG